MVYENAKILGPYISKKDGRLRIFVNQKCLSYPKYLMEKHLDRYLEKNETVDHIDGNPLNNEISNLRVLDRKEHCSNDAIRNKDVVVTCTMCGKQFTIKGDKLYLRNRKDKHQSGYFCSKSCVGKYGALIQQGKLTHEKVNKVQAEKFKLHNYGDMMELVDISDLKSDGS